MMLGLPRLRRDEWGGEAPGDLLLRGQAVSVRPRPYREPPAHDPRTPVESSLRTPVEFRKRIAVTFLQADDAIQMIATSPVYRRRRGYDLGTSILIPDRLETSIAWGRAPSI